TLHHLIGKQHYAYTWRPFAYPIFKTIAQNHRADMAIRQPRFLRQITSKHKATLVCHHPARTTQPRIRDSTHLAYANPTSEESTGLMPRKKCPYSSSELVSTVGLTAFSRIPLGISKAAAVTNASRAPLTKLGEMLPGVGSTFEMPLVK